MPRLSGFGWASSCHAGGAHASYVLVVEKILPHRQQTDVIYLTFLLQDSTRLDWRLVVERFEELNVDVDIDMQMTIMITPRRCFLTL